MEQYQLPKELDWKHLRFCLDNYEAERLFIRDCGGIREDGKYHIQGRTKVREKLEGKKLDFRKNNSGLYMLIDSEEVFHFPLNKEKYYKGFSLAYERIEETEDGIGRMVILSTGVDPYDESLPEPRRSFLRTVLDDHLMEIFFKGRIHLKFHSWWLKPDFKFWTIVTSKEDEGNRKAISIQEAIRKQRLEYDEDN